MIAHAMRAGWPTLLRRLTESMVAILPLLALLFVPLLFGLDRLYPWLRPATEPDPLVRERIALVSSYLNIGWFLGRAGLFFAVWIVAGHWLRRWSRLQDERPARPVGQKLHVFSAALLPPVALALSFAAFDWLMSLTPTWYSTMYPVYFFAGGFLGSLATLTLLTAAADRASALPGVRPSHYHALGRLLFAFVIFWAYAAFFQLLLIWTADKPEEVTFYLARVQGGWKYASAALILAHFVLPFFVLLSYEIKRRRGAMALVAVWILAAHYLDVHWLVMPAAGRQTPGRVVLDLAAPWRTARTACAAALVPIHDPALPRALRYESSGR